MLLSVRLEAHFQKVQRISDTTTLPFAMHYLRSRVMEELDISHLTERLLQGKGELTPEDKYETWEKIKILSMVPWFISSSFMACLCSSSLSHLWCQNIRLLIHVI